MYQVLFAEDELLVRLGLQNSIDWKAYDMELGPRWTMDCRPMSFFRKSGRMW